MNVNMNFPGLKGVIIERVEEQENQIVLHVSLPKKEHACPSCGASTKKVHDYRVQKIKHLEWFERLTILFYKRRRYISKCGKRFTEKSPFADKYQRIQRNGIKLPVFVLSKPKHLKRLVKYWEPLLPQ